MTDETGPDDAFEEHAYRRAECDGHRFARQRDEAPLDPDIAAVLSWDGFAGGGGTVLELGCGDGFVTRFLAERGHDVVAVDSSPTAIERARRNVGELDSRVTWRVGDVCDLDGLEDATFGTILDSHCLHCVTEPARRQRFLKECRRLLGPGGLLFIVTMAAQSMRWIEEGGPEDVRYERDEQGCYVESRRYEGADRRTRSRIFVTEERLRGEIAASGLRILRFEVFAHEEDPEDLAFLVSCSALDWTDGDGCRTISPDGSDTDVRP